MFFKVEGEEGLQNPERRRTVHLRVGHVEKYCQFADWKVKGMGFPNFSKSRYEKS